MPRLLPACLLCLLLACTSQDDSGDEAVPRLLEARFQYDMVANPGFAPKPTSWSGDTLTLHDYWALADQPVLRGLSEWRDGELALTYEAASAMANDWMPTVETRLSILVPEGPAEVKLRFLAMSKARKPSGPEASLGVQDATRDRVLTVRRP